MRENSVLRAVIDSYVKVVSSIGREQYAAARRKNTEPLVDLSRRGIAKSTDERRVECKSTIGASAEDVSSIVKEQYETGGGFEGDIAKDDD